ncbi:unnamed protein product [Malus baccata var. baccata]
MMGDLNPVSIFSVQSLAFSEDVTVVVIWFMLLKIRIVLLFGFAAFSLPDALNGSILKMIN